MARPQEDPNPVEVVFEDPGGITKRSSEYAAAIRQVAKRPGVWARIRVFERDNRAYSARLTLIRHLAYDRRWEVKVSRLNGDDYDSPKRGVWIRYRTNEQMKELPSREHTNGDDDV